MTQTAVVGAGQMGLGIAQVVATHGHDVFLFDVEPILVNRAVDKILQQLDRQVDRGKLQLAERDATMARIHTVSSLEGLSHVDMVIEAVIEDLAIKQQVFADLDRLCQPAAILATNTSSISVTQIAASTRRPEQVIGVHFMNPVVAMPLVEVIRGLCTSEKTFGYALNFVQSLAKNPVAVEDAPGFVVNRILIPMINEAVFVLQENVATAQDIDLVMKLGARHPMGPLELADLIGLDTCLAILETLYRDIGEDKYRPAYLLKKYVNAGWLGKKSGRGFFVYEK